ncbi:type II secretion system protein [Planctomicrobium piriforme]|uniref:Prepilin-type N-terminal cleavage/methylation domain-containing protein n=1 Tax=Planctomicrobium piriforme TaxID=1576369 RepID=A0A1I3RZU6_9PLAN|nr:type II secretion system protein [Planctomicrobium piriforme]SFJ50821.1 prepilin-type N-terminal cleavage/methylation domain-containing protein [Planctomicrobium piriforme]
MRSKPQHSARRSAFTLIEVLVVIGIMALLVTLLVMAIGPSLESAKVSATRVTIAQINEVIQQRIDAINRLDLTSEATRFANASGLSQANASLILRKNLYRQALPQSVKDLGGLDLDTSTASDNSPIYALWQAETPSGPPTSSTTNHLAETECSEVLYYALTKGSRIRVTNNGKSFNIPTLPVESINPRHIKDTDNDQLPEFVDAWERPLRFYRWPTRLVRTGGAPSNTPADIAATDRQQASVLISSLPSFAGTTLVYSSTLSNTLNQDPDDPTGVATLSLYGGSTFTVQIAGGSPTSVTALPFTEANYHTPNTYWTPLLASGGPDEAFGLGDPTSSSGGQNLCTVTVPAEVNDNITNRQQ